MDSLRACERCKVETARTVEVLIADRAPVLLCWPCGDVWKQISNAVLVTGMDHFLNNRKFQPGKQGE